ncbi:hypothetical protein OSB04_002646 [Centaurea solstitialis]|uniref:Uncharacterized protein n=1 Tax=Centaurea solstitialis TaxID=347529 RepID=A0AA38U529_9ASTR|nr:hypothetical protein OSB04_002646 [Centaurea solstitialis]
MNVAPNDLQIGLKIMIKLRCDQSNKEDDTLLFDKKDMSGLIVANIRQATSRRSSECFLWAFLAAAGAFAGGASPSGSSSTYHFLSCLSTIIRLRSQSRKLEPVNLSFSRIERRERLLVLVTVLAIYTK